LAKHRGARNIAGLQPLTERQILNWTDWHQGTNWRMAGDRDGPILDSDGETWRTVDVALRKGGRALPGRIVTGAAARTTSAGSLPPLSIDQILV
jgi:hypothetical protein